MMNTTQAIAHTRLILVLDHTPCKQSRQALQSWQKIWRQNPAPTFAVGLVQDVTLYTTGELNDVIYNAQEFMDVRAVEQWECLRFQEIYTLIKGQVYRSLRQQGSGKNGPHASLLNPCYQFQKTRACVG